MDAIIQIMMTPVEVVTAKVSLCTSTQVPKIFVDLREVRITDLPWISAGVLLMFSGALVAGLSFSVNSYLQGFEGLASLIFFGLVGLSMCITGTLVILFKGFSYKWLPTNFELTCFHRFGIFRDFSYFYEPNLYLNLKLLESVKHQDLTVTEQLWSNSRMPFWYSWFYRRTGVYNIIKPVRKVAIPRALRNQVLPFDLLSKGVKDDEIPYVDSDPVLVLHQRYNATDRLVFCETLIVDYLVLDSVFSPTVSGPKFTKLDRELRIRALLSGKVGHVMTGSSPWLDGVDVYHDSLKFHNLVGERVQSAAAPEVLNT